MTQRTPVHTRETNDCALCATEYAARVFGVEVDRDLLKQEGNWNARDGVTPHVTSALVGLGFEVLITWPALPIRKLAKRVQGPDWSDPRCNEAIRQMYRHFLGMGFVAVTRIQVETPCDHSVVVEAIDEQDTLTVVCSLQGRYQVPLLTFVHGREHKHGLEVWWVRRKEVA